VSRTILPPAASIDIAALARAIERARFVGTEEARAILLSASTRAAALAAALPADMRGTVKPKESKQQ
jgi:hypothetical protein